MAKQNSKKIEKPWAVYGPFITMDLGKIIEDSKNSCYIQSSENAEPFCWDSIWVRKFDNPLDAINYFSEHNSNRDYYNKEKTIELFLMHFPSERKNLKRLLAQSKPKCTKNDDAGIGDYFGRASHPLN